MKIHLTKNNQKKQFFKKIIKTKNLNINITQNIASNDYVFFGNDNDLNDYLGINSIFLKNIV